MEDERVGTANREFRFWESGMLLALVEFVTVTSVLDDGAGLSEADASFTIESLIEEVLTGGIVWLDEAWMGSVVHDIS